MAIIADSLPMGGAEVVQRTVITNIDRDRFDPHVICLREAGTVAEQMAAAGVGLTVLGHRRLDHLHTVPRLVSILRKLRTQVVLLNTHHATLALAPIAAKLAGAGLVMGLHQVGAKDIGIPSFPGRSVDGLFMLDALVLLHPEQLEYIREVEGYGRFPWRRAPIAVIPNGVEIPPGPTFDSRAAARREMGVTDDDQVVGILARLRPEKNHDLLIRAIARLVHTHPRLRLVVIGDGPCEGEIRQRIDEFGIADRVRLMGLRSDAQALMAGWDIKCLVSTQETFPVSVLEAMAVGVPVVMTAPPWTPNLVPEGICGHRIAPGDEDALVDRLDRLLSDGDARRSMGFAARQWVAERYPVSSMIERYERLFSWVADRRQGA